MKLEAEKQKYFDDLSETFQTNGWRKHVMEDVFQRYEGNSRMLNQEALTDIQIHELRGAQRVLKSLLDYEKIVNLIRDNEEQELIAQQEEDEENAAAAI